MTTTLLLIIMLLICAMRDQVKWYLSKAIIPEAEHMPCSHFLSPPTLPPQAG